MLNEYQVCDLCGKKSPDHMHFFTRVKTCCMCAGKGSNYRGPRMIRDFHTESDIERMKAAPQRTGRL